MPFLKRSVISAVFALVPAIAVLWLPAGSSWAASTYYVSPSGNDANPGTQSAPWRTIQRAADLARAGDTVIVKPGSYVGAKFSRSGTASSPIRFRAEPGAVVTSPGPLNSNGDNLWVRNANYVFLIGFEVHSAPRAGIGVQGEPSAPAVGVVVRQCNCHDNGRWGIFTGYAQNFRAEKNVASGSDIEHGIYVSNSADNPVIRGNVVRNNNASGIQINADPVLAGDGIITGALVERNIVSGNGVGGGAAINLASVRNSTFRNNILYENHASGFAGWDDGAGSQWGTKNNRFYNNTVVQASDGRFAASLQNGSSGNVVKNNILFHPGPRGTYDIDSSSRSGLVSDYNVVSNVFSVDETFINFAAWKRYGHDSHSLMVTSMSGFFVNASGGNYHLASGSPAINRGTTVPVPNDIDGQSRPRGSRYDIGSDEA
ncbi:MAG TPA: right-handed parallel beta-helix repeat-containing protein [Actinomycetota bacterium]|nr:right-handed parallel beta-helix repeat-containing protein [Actinomycetota bacterium]